MLKTLKNLTDISNKLDVPEDVRDEVSGLFQEATEKNLLRGRSAENILSGAFYTACRKEGCPRTFAEIAESFDIDEKRVYSGYKHLVRNLEIDVPPIDSKDCIPHLVKKLDLNEEVEKKAREILEKTDNGKISSGRCPFGLAAAAIYISGRIENEKRSQRMIKEAANVSEVTVRSRIKEIINSLELDINVKNA